MFLKSNLYNVLPIMYGDLGTFGTACMIQEEDFQNVTRFYPFPIGSYMLANDDKLQVGVFFREFRMTVRQVVERFGRDPLTGKIDWSNISTKAKSLWETDNEEQWIDIYHVIRPNPEWDPKRPEARYKKFQSAYYEVGFSGQPGTSQAYWGAGVEYDKFLKLGGYDYFPVLAPRWEITGEDVYGTSCPGMEALGDIKQLQTGEKRALQAIDKMINPPMIGPTSLKQAKASILPGDITYMDVREGLQGFRPAHEVRFDLNSLEAKQEQVRTRIKRAFFEDLFLMLTQSDRRQITATEVAERKEEKLLALGPVLEQLNQDLFDPLIDKTYILMDRQGLIPTAPPELEGMDLKVEYISIMAQAQKLVGLGAVERFSGFVGNIAGVAPLILDKVDGDELIDVYADITSIPPGIVRGKDEVDQIRQQRAQAEAQAQQAENMKNAAGTIKQLSETDIQNENALTAIAGGLQ